MTSKIAKERLDTRLVDEGHAASRERAQAIIRAGVVFVGGQRVDKPGTRVAADAELDVRVDPCPYVSRGGLKLDAALQAFDIDPADRVCLDVGASTGGFTDCLLQRGAARVFAVDVGTNQLAWSIRSHERVSAHERINVRTWLEQEPSLVETIRASRPTLAVGDVSFISLRLILPAVAAVLPAADCDAVFLIKPQFEAGREAVGKGGIVRDDAARRASVDGVVSFAQASLGWTLTGLIESPIRGTKGNVEYLAGFRVG